MSDENHVREVLAERLFVGNLAARIHRVKEFSLVIDVAGVVPVKKDEHVVVITPTGRSSHSWEPDDLGKIIEAVVPVIESGGNVLIACRRGVSRSSTAAAAAMLTMGEAESVEKAITRCRHPTFAPASTSIGSLRRWWAARCRQGQGHPRQFPLLPQPR